METKVCTKCGQELPLTSEFWQWRKAIPKYYIKEGYCSYCKACGSQMSKDTRLKREAAWKEYFKDTKYSCCELCGFDIWEALEWHHNEPLKADSYQRTPEQKIGTQLKSVWPNTPKGKKLLEDIRECTRLCCNCHTLVHVGIKKI